MKKQALGKGIHAFIPEEYGILKEERLADVPIGQLKPSPGQPRKKFDEAAIAELANSIKTSGVLQPIVVVPEGDHYRIIIGERRWRAARHAGLQKVPVLIRHIPKPQQVEISLIENLQREDLNPIEIARAYDRLIAELGLTQQEIGDKVGRDRSSVANMLRLLKLPDDVQEKLVSNTISMGHARALLALEDPGQQTSLANRIVSKNLSVREVEALVQGRKKRPAAGKRSGSDADLKALEEELIRLMGTKVSISGNKRRGTVRIFYFSMEELNRIFDHFKGVRS